MRDAQRRAYDSLVRARDFGQERAADFPANSFGAQLFADLNDVVAELSLHAEMQTSRRSAAKQGTTSKAAARANLLEDLEAISRTARAMAINNPGLADLFRLPHSNGDQALLSTAHAFATDAVAYKADFIKHELPADFLEDLAADIAAFETADTERHNSTGAHVAATRGFDDTLERGLNIKRQLDAVVRNKYRDDPATLAAWTSATHVERPPKRKRKTPTPTDAPAK